jgi:hypothetical protein
MHRSHRHHHTLPRSEAQRALIGMRMLVPGIFPGEQRYRSVTAAASAAISITTRGGSAPARWHSLERRVLKVSCCGVLA